MLFKNIRLIDPSCDLDEILDLRITDGFFRERGTLSPLEGEEVVRGKGLVLAPGFCDVHVHFRDPGQTEKEDLHTGSLAAARGGYTSVVCMANTRPPMDTPEKVRAFYERAKEEKIHLYTVAALTSDIKGEELTDFPGLKEAGAVGFSDDGWPVAKEELLLEAMEQLKDLEMPLSLHEEDPRFIGVPGINQGAVSEEMGLWGALRAAEDLYVARDVIFAGMTGCKTDIQHISSGYAVDQVALAQKYGFPVVAEVTPHHFTLTEEAVKTKGTLAKMNPPLRTEEDRQRIIQGIKEGTLTILATDHAPHTQGEKAREFSKAPSGIIGLETALGLALRELVEPGHIDLKTLMAMMSTNPAKFYHLPGGTLKEGEEADFVLFDPEGKTTWDTFLSKSKNSPFLGETLPGKIIGTFVKGEPVYGRLP